MKNFETCLLLERKINLDIYDSLYKDILGEISSVLYFYTYDNDLRIELTTELNRELKFMLE